MQKGIVEEEESAVVGISPRLAPDSHLAVALGTHNQRKLHMQLQATYHALDATSNQPHQTACVPHQTKTLRTCIRSLRFDRP